MSECQGIETVRYPSCAFNYGNGGKLISIGFEGELYVRKSEKDDRIERQGRRIAKLESLLREYMHYCGSICNWCENQIGEYECDLEMRAKELIGGDD